MFYLIFLAINILSFLIILIKSKHMSIPVRLTIQGLIFLTSSILIYNLTEGWLKYLILTLNFSILGLTLFLTRNIGVIYDDVRILSFSFIKNRLTESKDVENSYRSIGNLVPQDNRELKYNDAIVKQDSKTSVRHTIVSGKNGSGKTYFIKSLARQDIDKGRNIVYADYKGAQNDANHLLTYAKKRGYNTYIIYNGLSDFNYDPMRNINNAARIESFMNSNEWSEPYYKRQTQLFLNKTIPLYAKMFDNGQKQKNINFSTGFNNYLKGYKETSDERVGKQGTQDILDLMLMTSTSKIYSNYHEKTLDFKNIIDTKEKYILVVLFDSNLKDTATSFSAVLYADLLSCYQNAEIDDNISVYADESSALKNITIMDDLLSRGRSAGLSVLLSFQSLNQISYNAGEDYLNVIVENVNSSVIFPGTSNDIAKKISGLGWSDETFNIQTLKSYDDKGIAPTIFYSSDYTGLNGDKKKRYVLKPYIFDVESEKAEIEDFISKLSTMPKFKIPEEKEILDNKNNNVKFNDSGKAYIDNLEIEGEKKVKTNESWNDFL